MTVKERLEALLAGKKIRCAGWPPEEYVCLDEGGSLVNHRGGFLFCWARVGDTDFGWELYKEPRKRVAWLNLYPIGLLFSWSTKEEADRNAGPRRVECRKIEWEVPE